MGKEWVIRKNMIELLVQYELGNDDIALNRITSLIKWSKNVMDKNEMQDAKWYLTLFKRHIQDPTSVSIEDLERYLKLNTAADSFDDEIKKLSFYCWLESKISGKNFYETLMYYIYKRK